MAAVAAHAFDRKVAETQISKSDVNNVIMDYLITEGYPSAAEKFAMEANIERRPDHGFIQQRVLIRDSIHRGDLQNAIEMINDLNPELLDRIPKLHFSLLRLQLVELIRSAFTSVAPNARPDPVRTAKAIEFAQQNLAPYATLDSHFKYDLERAMALLIVPRESWMTQQPGGASSSSSSAVAARAAGQGHSDFGQLAEIVDPSLRQKVAKDVNEAILASQGEKREANIRHLVRCRAWAENLARDKKVELPDRMGLGLDGDETEAHGRDENGHGADVEAEGNGGDTEMGEGGNGDGDDAMGSGSAGARASAPRRARLISGASATSAAGGGGGHGGDAMMTRYTHIPP